MRAATAVHCASGVPRHSAVMVVAMAAVPTLIAGIYGMNFDTFPELHWDFGYPLILLMMASIAGLMYRSFKKGGWF